MTLETFIPPRSKKVLELTGEVEKDFETTKEKFLQIQPACKYVVEKNLSDATEKFDAIIFQSPLIGNLDEKNLTELIKKSAEKLNQHGTLIFKLDNISYAENIDAILKGQPLKFKITLSRVELENSIKNSGANTFRTVNASRKVAVKRGLIEIAETDVAVFAHILSATFDDMPPKTLIQTIIGENFACGPTRIHIPNSFFVTTPNISTISVDSNKSYQLYNAQQFDKRIFINQRVSTNNFAQGLKALRTIVDKGYLYLSEIDDNPIRWKESYEKSDWINFVGVHAIQTSTKYLAEFLSQYNPHVKIFPNHLRRILPKRNFDEEFKNENRPTTIFFGALNRDKDFSELLPTLNEFAKKYGNKLAFRILGRTNLFEQLESENKILVGDKNYYDSQFVPYEKYEENLRASDIALLPLQDNQFNRSKSDLKFIECSANGAVALASPVVYSEVVKDGENGFIFKDLKEFADRLKILIENKNKRREMADNAYEYVLHNRLLSQHYEERLDWYNELFAKLPELTKELNERVEKLIPKFKDEIAREELRAAEFKPVAGNSPANAEIIIPV